MKNERLLLIITILLTLVSAASGIIGNLATSAVPEEWKPYLWIAWPAFGVFLLIAIIIAIWQWAAQREKPTLPPPPEKPDYIHEGWFLKHSYPTLPNFTGRKTQQTYLTDWLKNNSEKPLLVIVALGGFGKSSLSWYWLHHDETAKQLPRVVWWNFYEDNNFETFLSETLEYLNLKPESIGHSQQVEILTRYVRENRILLVLDGFERVLRIYNNMGAAYQGDEVKKDSAEEKQNNQCVSNHAANLLQRISSANAQGRVLITSRVLPSDLKAYQTEEVYDGCDVYELDKLSKEDAVKFFSKQKINGTRAEIEIACEVYGYHPLSLRLLAGKIAKSHVRDIKLAQQFKIDTDLKGHQNHILKIAYDSLPRSRQKLFSQISCFRSAMTEEQIKVFAGKAKTIFGRFLKPVNLHAALDDFAERGLLQYDQTQAKYDLHPIVRRYAYDRLTAPDKTAAHQRLVDYFETVPQPQKVEKLDDLALVIELYHHVVRAGKFDDARQIFKDYLDTPTYYQFGAYQLQIELLLSLFPDGDDKPPKLKTEDAQAQILNDLAAVYSLSGQPRRAVPLFLAGNEPDERSQNKAGVAIGLGNVAQSQLVIGMLADAERSLHRRIDLCREIKDEVREAVGHQSLGLILSYRGTWQAAEDELLISQKVFDEIGTEQTNYGSVNWAFRSLVYLFLARKNPSKNLKSSIEFANHALRLANEHSQKRAPYERDFVRAQWLLGAAHRASGVLLEAETHLDEALRRCRGINLVDSEADILLEIAKLRHTQGETPEALRLVREALIITERSEYVLQGADVHLFLATLALEGEKLEGEKEMSNQACALMHAQKARRLATGWEMIDGKQVYDESGEYVYKVAYDEAGRLIEKLQVEG